MMIDENLYVPDSSNKHFLGYLPNITGGIGLSTTQMSSSGAFTHWQSGGAQGWDGWNSYGNRGFSFDASRCSGTYGRGNLTYNNVIPASVSMKMIIKY